MKDNNCIFCKIANGDIPSRTIYENDLFRVILDNGPATDGHALVLPKDHYANLFEIPSDTAAEAMKTAQTVAAMLKENPCRYSCGSDEDCADSGCNAERKTACGRTQSCTEQRRDRRSDSASFPYAHYPPL